MMFNSENWILDSITEVKFRRWRFLNGILEKKTRRGRKPNAEIRRPMRTRLAKNIKVFSIKITFTTPNLISYKMEGIPLIRQEKQNKH